jgi:hypothetical protein
VVRGEVETEGRGVKRHHAVVDWGGNRNQRDIPEGGSPMAQSGIRRSADGDPRSDRSAAIATHGWQRVTPSYSIVAIIISIVLIIAFIVMPVLVKS